MQCDVEQYHNTYYKKDVADEVATDVNTAFPQ